MLIISLWVIPVYGGEEPHEIATNWITSYISYFLKTFFDTLVYIIAYDIGKCVAHEVEETIKEIRLEAEDEDSGSEDSGAQ